jgi:hypothetical protein
LICCVFIDNKLALRNLREQDHFETKFEELST